MSKELKTQFVKVHQSSKNKIQNGCGHSLMTKNDFSRRSSAVSINSAASSTNELNLVINHSKPNTNKLTNNSIISNKCYNRCKHSPQSWSMSNFKNDCNIRYLNKINNNNKYEFTEQRCNYERLTQQHELQTRQLQRPWSSEQVTQCNISNSRIPTCSFDQIQNDLKKTKFCKVKNAEFLALSEFRMQNIKDCFSDRHHRLLQLRVQTSPPNNKAMTSDKMTEARETQPFSVNSWFDKDTNTNENVSISLSSSSSSLLPALFKPIPYAARQRILREELAKKFPRQKSLVMGVNKSAALSYQSKY